MNERSEPTTGGERDFRRRLGPVFVVFLAVPTVLLVVLYATSVQIGVAFGDLVFALTGLTGVGWFLVTRSENESLAAAGTTKLGALAGWDELYARESASRSPRPYGSPGIVVLTLTATVILGWLVVAVRWILG